MTKISRRRFLQGGAAAAALSVGGCASEKNTRERLYPWSPAVEKLNDFLQKQNNKHVIAYWDHDAINLLEFYEQPGFWEMLKFNGFSDAFVEFPASNQADIDTASADINSDAMGDYLGVIFYEAAQQGIKTTGVDHGNRSDDNELYPYILDLLWKGANEKNPLANSARPEEIYATQVDYVRSQFGAYPRLEEMRDKYGMWLLDRLNDASTGIFSAQLAQKTQGRIWQSQGNAHFTPCGVHSYLQNPLIIDMYVDKDEKTATLLEEKYPDIFVDAMLLGYAPAHYDLFIQEAEIDYIPASDAQKLSQAYDICIDETQHPEKAFKSAGLQLQKPQAITKPAKPVMPFPYPKFRMLTP